MTIQRIALTTLGAAIIMSLAIALAGLTWHVAGDASAEAAAPLVATGRDAVVLRTDLAPILALSPFGSVALTTAEAPQETTLGFVLHGVVLADPASKSTAVIAASDAVPHVYGIGDTLPDSVVLETVLPDSVTLRVAGRLETLSFPKNAAQPGGVAAIRASIPASAGGGGTPASPRNSTLKSRDPDAIADDFRQRIASNPQTVLNDVGLAATPEGYKLQDTMMPELRRAGLKPGDLVVRVNGNKVGSVERDRDLFDDIVASGRARIEVMRDGSLIVMSFPLR